MKRRASLRNHGELEVNHAAIAANPLGRVVVGFLFAGCCEDLAMEMARRYGFMRRPVAMEMT